MRVAFFTDTYFPQVNGVTRTLERLRTLLEEQKWETMVFAPEVPGEQADKGREKEQVNRKPVASRHDLAGNRTGRCRGIPVPFYPQMRLGLPSPELFIALQEFKPHLIHLVTEYSLGVAGLRWARLLGVPAVSSFHTDIPGYLTYYGFPFLAPVAWQYLTWFHRQCRVTFYPCRSYGEDLAARGIRNLVYWGRGIDTDFFNPARKDPEWCRRFGPGPFLLYVGRLAPEKEPEVAIAALALVRQQYPEARLLVAGEGPLAASLRRQTPPGVVFLGLVQGEELSKLYASCDLFLFPSTTETYGNVVLEAMASGLPVVAPLCGGISENLRPGYNGLACEPHSPGAMARAAVTLLDNRPLRIQLAVQARRHAEGRTWLKALTPVVKTYEEVLAGKYTLTLAS